MLKNQMKFVKGKTLVESPHFFSPPKAVYGSLIWITNLQNLENIQYFGVILK
ncbi:MAG: hypothetical protein KAW52_06930 [candidate division Zixibacteria bacterium]|nr:hypothetical protein [candidate division Zixibacteria bacterium]